MNYQEQLKQLTQSAQEEQRRMATQTATSVAHTTDQDNDDVDFAALMHDVVPLKNPARYRAPTITTPIKVRPPEHETADEHHFYVGTNAHWQDPPAVFSKNGQGAKDLKRLQAGHWPVVADVDLHGYTQEEAQTVLNEFIAFVQNRGVCGEIIHGSGLGSRGYVSVLRTLVRRWLIQHPDVLAYAPPRHGNDGAVRILIKRKFRFNPWDETHTMP